MLNQPIKLKKEPPLEPCLANAHTALSDVEMEHFKSLCQELSATILEQYGKQLQHYGAVNITFDFPHFGKETLKLAVHGDVLTIGRYSDRNSIEAVFI